MNAAARTTDATERRRPAHHRPRPRPDNDNVPQPARIVSKPAVLRGNITADSLNAVADAQRGERGKVQRRELRALAREVQAERGW